ncbi:helix-turn-helix domain-containing protein [Spirillospora sp. CA-142024]|uniref:arsenate reductase/protein-tyrosine-phosphatase family protein n=1 Tax=Spirillospora sp. CA-142024 TaxID=3240036 RepID=UPI003D8BC315
MVEGIELKERAAIHAALAEPARLAVIDALVLGDASPGELADKLGLPSNLLAHHLKVLAGAGLVQRGRSEADRRRTYVRLVPSALAGLNPAVAVLTRAATRVVFVCTHNSARSQLAAALWNQNVRHPEVPAASAGTSPSPRVHPRALGLAHRHDLQLDPDRTAHVRDVLRPGDLVVAVCDNAYEDLLQAAGLHWSVPDPVRVGTDAAFETAFTDIAARVERLAPAITPTAAPTQEADAATVEEPS